jgi:hypothetical protein
VLVLSLLLGLKGESMNQKTGNQPLQAIGKSLTGEPNTRVHMLEKIYETCESRSLYGVEIRRIEGGWKQYTGYSRNSARC